MLRHRTLRTANLKKKKRKRTLIRSGILIGLFVLLIAGLSWAASLPRFQVKKVDAVGNTLVTASEIWQTIDEETQGKYLYLFPKKNFIFFPKRHVLAAVAAQFPIFDGAKIDLEGVDTVRLRVTERKPVALWCQGAVHEEGDCYFVDEHAYIYGVAPDFKGIVYVKYFGGIDFQDPIGHLFLTRERFSALAEVLAGVDKLGLNPSKVSVKDYGDYEIVISNGGILLLNQKTDPDHLLINLETFLSQNKSTLTTHDIQYVDLRFGNKIFYKFN